MKKVILYLLLTALLVGITIADYSDGWITEGEYEYAVDWTSYDPPLIVEGGGDIGLKSGIMAASKCVLLRHP